MNRKWLIIFSAILFISGCTSSRYNFLEDSARITKSVPEEWRGHPAIILKDHTDWNYAVNADAEPQAILERYILIQFNKSTQFIRELDIPFNSEVLEFKTQLIRNGKIVRSPQNLIKDESYTIGIENEINVHKKTVQFNSGAGDVLALFYRIQLDYFPINHTWRLDDVLPKVQTSFTLTIPKEFPRGSKYDFSSWNRYTGVVTSFYQNVLPSSPEEYYFAHSDPAYIELLDLEKSDLSYYFVNEARIKPETNIYNATNLVEIKWNLRNIESTLEAEKPGKSVLLALKKIKGWTVLGQSIADLYFPDDLPRTDPDSLGEDIHVDKLSPEQLLERVSNIFSNEIKLVDIPLSLKWLRPLEFNAVEKLSYALPQDVIYYAVTLLRQQGIKSFIGILSLPDTPPLQRKFLSFQGNRMLIGFESDSNMVWYDPVEGLIRPETDSQHFAAKTKVFKVTEYGRAEFSTLFPEMVSDSANILDTNP